MLNSLFFPDKFHTNRFTVFRQMVVSSEKIICSQFLALFYLELILNDFFQCTLISAMALIMIDYTYMSAALFKHRCIVVLSLTVALVFLDLFARSQAVTNVYCSARETICSPCLRLVARARPDRIESLQSFDCLRQEFTAVTSHLTVFATVS